MLRHVPLEAQTLLVVDDKSAFLAATGAASATGPLPDIGVVADGGNPAGTARVGSLTFSLAPGGDNLYIGAAGTGGAPDWYPNTPGNDIALGFENLAVRVARPVFSLGFEIVEPDATLPPYGGTPVESKYKVTLFNGVTVVGEAIFNSIPNDVAAFIGVWSDILFDRVAIVDVTESPFVDDDEYFGEFYTGAEPAPPTTTSEIIATGAAVPGGTGTFTAFPQGPAVGSTIAAFLGVGSGGQAGIYARVIPTRPGHPSRSDHSGRPDDTDSCWRRPLHRIHAARGERYGRGLHRDRQRAGWCLPL
jgi:hypothetical protein